MSKILHLEITRSESTDVYIEVPDDFIGHPPLGKVARTLAKEAAKRTITDFDWDKADWDNTLEVQSSKLLSDAESNYIKDQFRYLKIEDAQRVIDTAKLTQASIAKPAANLTKV